MSEVVDRVDRIGRIDLPLPEKAARLAVLQHGAVAAWQLLRFGYTYRRIYLDVRAGHLQRLYRGVYAVGHRRLTREGRWMAAVLACGPSAVLSHRAAAALWGLRRGTSSGPVDVSVPGRSRRGQSGIRAHNTRALAGQDLAIKEGIPTTSSHRTLLDIAWSSRGDELRLAFEAAERLELLDLRILSDLLDRSRGRRGVRAVRDLIEQQIAPPDTRSSLERRFLDLVRAVGLPEPQVNVVVEGFVVDFYWPEKHLIVEVDSYAYHRSRRSFEEDRGKDVKLQLAGKRVLRVTDRQIDDRPSVVQGDLLAMISAAA